MVRKNGKYRNGRPLVDDAVYFTLMFPEPPEGLPAAHLPLAARQAKNSPRRLRPRWRRGHVQRIRPSICHGDRCRRRRADFRHRHCCRSPRARKMLIYAKTRHRNLDDACKHARARHDRVVRNECNRVVIRTVLRCRSVNRYLYRFALGQCIGHYRGDLEAYPVLDVTLLSMTGKPPPTLAMDAALSAVTCLPTCAVPKFICVPSLS